MNTSSRIAALFLIFSVTLLFLGAGMVAHGGYNLLTLETVSEIVQQSGHYEKTSYGSLEEWRSQYVQANASRLVAGLLVLGVGGYLVAKARSEKRREKGSE